MSASLQLLAVLLVAAPGDGPAWGGFRGNNGRGVSDSTDVPTALDPEANLAWRTEIPAGYSSPVVAGDHVFLTAAEGEELLTLCLDRADGEVLWRKALEFDGKRPGANSPAAPSPVTDGERLYVLFHSAGLVAYDLAGNELWHNEMGPFDIPHGMSTSPLVSDDLVVVLVDQDKDSYLAAYDKKTGAERWKTARPAATHSYSTPAIYAPEDGPAQVVVSGSLQVSGYDLASGERVWWVDGSAWQTKSVPVFHGDVCIVNAYMVSSSEFGFPKLSQSFAQAVAEFDEDGDGMIGKPEWGNEPVHQAWFIFDLDDDGLLVEGEWEYLLNMGSATGGLFAIDPGGKGNVTESHVKWTYDDRRGLPDAPSPLVLGDTLYLIKEGGLMTAIDATTGEVSKQGRVGEPDRYFASPVAADGKVITASQSGQLAVVSAGPEWEVLSVHSLDEQVWSTPAIADGQVFVRSQNALYCFAGAPD